MLGTEKRGQSYSRAQGVGDRMDGRLEEKMVIHLEIQEIRSLCQPHAKTNSGWIESFPIKNKLFNKTRRQISFRL